MTLSAHLFRRPMLAATPYSLADLPYPLIGTPKIDGARALTETTPKGTVILSRTGKLISHPAIQTAVRKFPPHLDGELWIEGAKTPGETMSYVNTKYGGTELDPRLRYLIFDYRERPSDTYVQRLGDLTDLFYGRHPNYPNPPLILPGWVRILPTRTLNTFEDLLTYEAEMLEAGHEGICVRKPSGHYKFNRATLREALLLKIKRFVTHDAFIVDMVEMQHNENAPTVDERGYTKRSTHKAGKVASGMLGTFVCQGENGVRFEVGSGFDHAFRRHAWEHPEEYLQHWLEYKSQPFGEDAAPRHAVFLRMRPDLDPA